MEKLFMSLVLVLVLILVSVRCEDSQIVKTEADALQQLLELIKSMAHEDRQPVQDTGPEDSPGELWSEYESVEKRDLPRLGVSVYRPLPPRGQSSKSMATSRYRFSYPAERMARLHG